MLQVRHILLPPAMFFEELNKSIPSKIIDNQFIIDPSFGDGTLKYLFLQEGLWIYEMAFKLNDGLILLRDATESNDYFMINFYLSQTTIKQQAEGQDYMLSFDEVSLLLNSSCAEFVTEIPKNKQIVQFGIGFSSEWLKEHVLENGYEALENLFTPHQAIYLSERLNSRFTALFNEIQINKRTKLENQTNALIILNEFFLQLSKRKSSGETQIHFQDMKQVMTVHRTISENIQDPLSVEELAENAGMSLSKFKRLYKQIVGLSPYQYHLKCKMDKAMELIKSGETSISEIGYLLGYSNISQFSKAFKKQYNILPSKVLS